jgi:mannose-6-phosphate isomerase-like protein (cupin superfamily)
MALRANRRLASWIECENRGFYSFTAQECQSVSFFGKNLRSSPESHAGGHGGAQQPTGEQPAQAAKTFTSSADITALISKAKSERKEGQALVSERILQLTPYNANLECRASVCPAAVHEREAEIFYVMDGAATMVIGGRLVNEARTNPAHLTGTAIEGGGSQKVAKGDLIIVPENTPHWFSAIEGTLLLTMLHVGQSPPHLDCALQETRNLIYRFIRIGNRKLRTPNRRAILTLLCVVVRLTRGRSRWREYQVRRASSRVTLR